MKHVFLTWEECKTAYQIGKVRQIRNEATGGIDIKIDPDRDSIELHMQGMGGEMAFAKMVNCYPSFATRPRRGGCDFEDFEGLSIDVKRVYHATPGIMTPLHKAEHPCDIYILLNGKISWPIPDTTTYIARYDLIGWIRGAEFLTEENKRNLGHGDCFFVPGARLNPNLEEILTWPIRALEG